MAKRTDTSTQNNKVVVSSVEKMIDLNNYTAEVAKPDEYMGRPFIIMGFETMSGRHGDFVHIEAIDVVTENPIIISTGGGLIMKALNDLQNASAFPSLATFGKSGNAFVFRPATINRSVDLAGIVERYLYGEQQQFTGQEWTENS